MPRAATAIIAIACTGYLGPDAGLVPSDALRCEARHRRNLPLSKRVVLKKNLASQYEATAEQHKEIQARTEAWKTLGNGSQALFESEVQEPLDEDGTFELEGLPEEVLLHMSEYVGTPCRAACRASKRCCDASLRENLVLPSFPLTLRVKQHYYFDHDQVEPVTTTWSLEINSPSSPATLEVHTGGKDDVQAGVATQKAVQSGTQVLALCRELRSLQQSFGARHKEDGQTQVDIVAIDAAGRTFLDHSYRHRFLRSKADDILELLTEPDFPDATCSHSMTMRS